MRIAIVSKNDTIWALDTWERTIPMIRAHGHEVVGLFACNGQLGPHQGLAEMKWYVTLFGARISFMLAIFSTLIFLRRHIMFLLGTTSLSIKSLAKKECCHYGKLMNPNDPGFQVWLRNNKVDTLVIMVDQILSKKTLNIPKLGTINKHASALPANKGLFPYLWAKINDSPQGISFHLVKETVDSGRLLAQELNIPKNVCRTMISYYNYVFDRYPLLLLEAISRLASGQHLTSNPKIKPSYNGLPDRIDMKNYLSTGSKIIDHLDLLHVLNRKSNK
jgi:hypothetical protein